MFDKLKEQDKPSFFFSGTGVEIVGCTNVIARSANKMNFILVFNVFCAGYGYFYDLSEFQESVIILQLYTSYEGVFLVPTPPATSCFTIAFRCDGGNQSLRFSDGIITGSQVLCLPRPQNRARNGLCVVK